MNEKLKLYSADQISSSTLWKRILWVVRSQDTPISSGFDRRRLFVDVGQLIIKMIFAIFLLVCKRAFDSAPDETLTVFPGCLLTHVTLLMGDSVMFTVIEVSRYIRDEDLRRYWRRKVAMWSGSRESKP